MQKISFSVRNRRPAPPKFPATTQGQTYQRAMDESLEMNFPARVTRPLPAQPRTPMNRSAPHVTTLTGHSPPAVHASPRFSVESVAADHARQLRYHREVREAERCGIGWLESASSGGVLFQST